MPADLDVGDLGSVPGVANRIVAGSSAGGAVAVHGVSEAEELVIFIIILVLLGPIDVVFGLCLVFGR